MARVNVIVDQIPEKRLPADPNVFWLDSPILIDRLGYRRDNTSQRYVGDIVNRIEPISANLIVYKDDRLFVMPGNFLPPDLISHNGSPNHLSVVHMHRDDFSPEMLAGLPSRLYRLFKQDTPIALVKRAGDKEFEVRGEYQLTTIEMIIRSVALADAAAKASHGSPWLNGGFQVVYSPPKDSVRRGMTIQASNSLTRRPEAKRETVGTKSNIVLLSKNAAKTTQRLTAHRNNNGPATPIAPALSASDERWIHHEETGRRFFAPTRSPWQQFIRKLRKEGASIKYLAR